MEELILSRQTTFLVQQRDCASKQNNGPLPFEALFRIPAIGARHHFIYFLLGRFSQRHEIDPAPTLLRVLVIFSIGHEVFQGTQKKGTKPSLVGISVNMEPRLDKIGEETLREILGIMPIGALAAKEQV